MYNTVGRERQAYEHPIMLSMNQTSTYICTCILTLTAFVLNLSCTEKLGAVAHASYDIGLFRPAYRVLKNRPSGTF
jgi:hypothetical protein